jgi:hypothetical protein
MDDMKNGWMDGWKKLHKKRPRRPLLYVITWAFHMHFISIHSS